MAKKQKPNEKCKCNSGLKYKKCCSITDNIKTITCNDCGFDKKGETCLVCEDIYTTRMNCEKQVDAKGFIFGNMEMKYGKQYQKFLKSYNIINNYPENKISDVVCDMVICARCGAVTRMKRTRKTNVINNRTCTACKGKTNTRKEEIIDFVKEVEDEFKEKNFGSSVVLQY